MLSRRATCHRAHGSVPLAVSLALAWARGDRSGARRTDVVRRASAWSTSRVRRATSAGRRASASRRAWRARRLGQGAGRRETIAASARAGLKPALFSNPTTARRSLFDGRAASRAHFVVHRSSRSRCTHRRADRPTRCWALPGSRRRLVHGHSKPTILSSVVYGMPWRISSSNPAVVIDAA